MDTRSDPAADAVQPEAGRLGRWRGVCWPVAIALGVLALQLVAGAPGTLSPESAGFLQHYLSDKSLPELIFDSRHTEFGLYQGRELSYFFDFVDVRFVDLCARLGLPHFLSLTYLVFVVAIAILAARFFIRDLALPPPVAAGLIALYATAPAVVTWNSFGRSAKVGVALCCILAIGQLYRIGIWPGRGEAVTGRRLLGLALVLIAMVLFDRQGVFMVAMLGAYLLGALGVRRNATDPKVLTLACGVLLLSACYTYAIAPWLTYRINGYWPDMHYLELDLGRFLRRAMPLLASGAQLLLDAFRFMYGNVPALAAAAALLALLALLRRWNLRALAALVPCLIVVMNALMVWRHPAVLDEDMRRASYWNPQTALLLMLVPILLSHVRIPLYSRLGQPERRSVLVVLLWGMALANLIALPSHMASAYGGYMAQSKAASPEVLVAVRELRHGKRAQGAVALDPAYQVFRQRLLPAAPDRDEGEAQPAAAELGPR